MRTLLPILILLTLLIASGCNSSIARPSLCHPGWADEQRNRAQRFDPYPEVDWGQWMYGTRPIDFMHPAPEPQQTQNKQSFLRRYGQYAPNSRY
jgi:hypothetical protein